ncbi:MAG: hypothetical protein RR086_06265, partial [Clostridia bacterium]
TSKVYFAVPYNFAITLKKGNYDIKYAYKFLPGSSLTVDADATLTVSSGLYIYNGLAQSDMSGKSYPTTAKLMEKGYKGNSNFINNGNFVVGANATFGGIIQTNSATAKITTSATAKLVNTGVFDGGTTPYDCNKSVFDLPAQIYTNGALYDLKTSGSYVSTGSLAWTLPSYTTKYAINTEIEAESVQELYASSYKKYHKYTPITTVPLNSSMVGSWVISHEHILEWHYVKTSTSTTEGERYIHCTQPGCTYREPSEILPMIGHQSFARTYDGKNLSTFVLNKDFRWKDSTIVPTCDRTKYTAIYNGYLTNYVDYEIEIEIILSKRQVIATVPNQAVTYSGSNGFNIYGFTLDGSFLSGDQEGFNFALQLASGAGGINAGNYNFTLTYNTAQHYSNNYNIVINYVSGSSGVFTVNKAIITTSNRPTASSIFIGQDLSASVLSNGDKPFPGKFVFKSGQVEPTCEGDYQRVVMYVLNSGYTNNYETVDF